jgi:two-component system cell cycle response regulator
VKPIDRQECAARVNSQIRRRRYTESLRANVIQSIELATTDPLTGLHNRRFMERRLSALVSQAVNCGKLLGVLAVDIDNFRAINDAYGQRAGDAVLQELARRMRENVRSCDLPCRTDGEEFVVILPDADAQETLHIAERVCAKIATTPFDIGEGLVGVTVSIGVAALEGLEDSHDKLLRRADQALQHAKRSGKNRVNLAAA